MDNLSVLSVDVSVNDEQVPFVEFDSSVIPQKVLTPTLPPVDTAADFGITEIFLTNSVGEKTLDLVQRNSHYVDTSQNRSNCDLLNQSNINKFKSDIEPEHDVRTISEISSSVIASYAASVSSGNATFDSEKYSAPKANSSGSAIGTADAVHPSFLEVEQNNITDLIENEKSKKTIAFIACVGESEFANDIVDNKSGASRSLKDNNSKSYMNDSRKNDNCSLSEYERSESGREPYLRNLIKSNKQESKVQQVTAVSDVGNINNLGNNTCYGDDDVISSILHEYLYSAEELFDQKNANIADLKENEVLDNNESLFHKSPANNCNSAISSGNALVDIGAKVGEEMKDISEISELYTSNKFYPLETEKSMIWSVNSMELIGNEKSAREIQGQKKSHPSIIPYDSIDPDPLLGSVIQLSSSKFFCSIFILLYSFLILL